jgi:hypothetical protein
MTDELGRKRTGDPDRMAEPDAETTTPEAESGGDVTNLKRPYFPTSAEQREFGSGRPDELEGLAVKEDAAPGADSQGG